MVSLRHAFVNPEGRTLARPSYPTPDCDLPTPDRIAWELVATLYPPVAASGKSCRSCGHALPSVPDVVDGARSRHRSAI